MQSRFAIVSLVLAAAAAPALAADRKVPSAAYPTITDAVAAAQAGDRIVVGPGFYGEHVVTNVANLQFVGKKAVWDGTTDTGVAGQCLVSTGGGTVVQGFTFRNGAGAQLDLSGDGCRVVKCTSRNARRFLRLTGDGALVQSVLVRGSQSGGGPAVFVTGSGATVDRCDFRNCDSMALRVDGDTATVVKCVIQSIEDDGGILVVGNGAQVLKNRISNVNSDGIEVQGNGAVITSNRIADPTNNGVSVAGTGAAISKNAIQGADAGGISVEGDGATVSYNTVELVQSRGIDVTGANVTIDGNSVTRTGQSGIQMEGHNPTITRNRVNVTIDDADGIKITTDNLNTSGLVESNTVTDSIQYGFDVEATSVTVRSNVALRCGTEGEAGFNVSGSSNVLEGDTAVECGNDGFYVEGDRNRLTRCVATNCYADGFDIATGNGSSLSDCRATGCDGEGLDNSGTNTTATGCKFTGNRIDVANDGTISNDGTFVADNTFKTGGTTKAPQVE